MTADSYPSMTIVNGVEIYFLKDKSCTLCEAYFDLEQGPKFLDLKDQIKHFEAVHPFLLTPKPMPDGGI